MKLSISAIFTAILLVINILLSMLPGRLQIISICLSIAIGCYIFIFSIKRVYLNSDIFQPIVICNVFLVLFFILRPIYLLFNINSFYTFGYFKYYNLLSGGKVLFDYSVAKAVLIGIVGMFFVNQGYFSNQKLKQIRPFKYNIENSQNNGRQKSVSIICYFLLSAALLFWMLYIYRAFVQGGKISTIYVIWVYILTVSLPIYIAYAKKINILMILILCISTISLVSLGNRQLIVSLLLCVVVAQIQFNTNSVKKFGKTICILCASVMVVALVIVWFASVRYERDFSLTSVIDNLFKEFAMFDMLVVSLDAQAIGLVPNYYFGRSFLNFFSFFLPSIDVLPFDHLLVQDVFRGVIGGGIPVSVVGTLYMNFGYIGLIVLSFVLGRCFSAVYIYNRNKVSFEGDLQNIVFLTFVYDLTRVGDFSKEFVVFLILFLCLKIAFLFINRDQDKFLFKQIHVR